jgi:GDP-4-dehydro-6-deoxy-D-mannose reductase
MFENILVSGASGFVGRLLSPALLAMYPGARIIETRGPGDQNATGNSIVVDIADERSVSEALKREQPDLIVHLAGQSSPGASEADPRSTWTVNISGALNMALGAALHVPKTTLFFTSSAQVYGTSFLASPVTEASPTQPTNPYSKSKLICEQIFDQVLPPSCRLLIARPVNHTGPGQREDFVLASFAHQIARIEAGLQPPRLSVGNIDVQRDFLDVSDVIEAYLSLIRSSPRLPQRVMVNVASGTPRSLSDLLAIFRTFSDADFEVVKDAGKYRRVDLHVAYADAGLLTALTGWKPRVPIEQTLSGLLKAARAQCRAAAR